MHLDFNIKLNSQLYLRDPESTDLGKEIIASSIKLIYNLGYEQFTFKKLAAEITCTEATIYRYFENKHKLLIYLIDCYWAFMEFQIVFKTNNVVSPKEKINTIIDLLVWEDNSELHFSKLDQKALYYIAIAESNKTYLSKGVDENNKDALYQPYKDLCKRIADIFMEYKPGFTYPKSLASSLVEMSHLQYYFMQHLPRLCDFEEKKSPKEIEKFLAHFVFGTLDYGGGEKLI